MSDKHEVERDNDEARVSVGVSERSEHEHEGREHVVTIAAPAPKEMLIDGSFETSKVGANSWTHTETVGGWKSDTQIETWGKNFYGIKATDGDKFAELDYDNRASNIYQDVKTEAGVEYSFNFDTMKRPDSKQGSDTVLVFLNGKQIGAVEPGKEWAKSEFKFVGTGGDDRIEFREESGDNDSYGGLIDNASLKSTGRVEREAAEKAAKEAADKAAKEAAEKAKEASEKAKAAADKAAADKAAAEKAAAEKAAAEKAAAEKAAAEKAAAEKVAAEKAATEKAAAEKAAAEKAAAEKGAAEKAAAEKAAAEKGAAEKAAAEKAAAEKAAAEKAAAEKAAAEKAAAEKAAAEKAAAEKAAADKAAADKVAADKAAAEKAAADKAAADKAAADEASKHSDLHMGDNTVNKLVGDEHVSVMFGEGGKDTLIGNGGDDVMHGGGGDDTMSGDEGNDLMFGSSTAGGKVDMSKFKVTEDTNAHITFNYESAGYKNALGMYKIAADGTISGVQVLFANASLKGSGGDLIGGVSAVDVGVKAGEKLGFFVVPDGFSQRGMAALLSDKSASFKFVGADGKPGNVNGGSELKLVQVNSAGVETLVKSAYGTTIFHSVDNGAMGLNGDNMSHVHGTADNINGTVKIGFEDLKWGGDKDFDDTVFSVSLGVTNTSLLAKEATKAHRSSDNDLMTGGTGNDKMFGMADNDKMDGGTGDDQMWGNSGNDAMNGGEGNDFLSGGKGDDIIFDGLGNDKVEGNTGNDKFVAGEGNDSYDGGAGFDTLDYSNSARGMNVDLNTHVATGMGADTVKGVEAVIGSRFNDTLVGDKNANTFVGGAGDDSFRGRGGADTFVGGAGRDMYNWTKKDVNAVDHITDFGKGDSLNLHDLLKGQKFADAVKVTDGKAGSTVSVKFDGAYHDVVVLDGVHGHSAAELLKAGMILA